MNWLNKYMNEEKSEYSLRLTHQECHKYIIVRHYSDSSICTFITFSICLSAVVVIDIFLPTHFKFIFRKVQA